MTKITDYAYSLLNKRVTVPYNPFGGQCVSFVDHLATHFTGKNLEYTNAIDLLEKARSQGFKVTYFTGSEIPKVGDIWVTATSNHPFGHTGIFTKVDKTGSYFTTLEQNVDLNGDALENGGWVREKNRTLYVDGTFTYDNDILLPQTMVGWFTFYEDKAPTVESNKENQEVDMSHTFEIFIREDGKQFYINLAEGTYYHIPNPKALKTLEAHYKFRFKKSIYKEKVTKAKFDEYAKAFGLKEKTI